MRQGDAMQRLNMLALFYLPLSFMAVSLVHQNMRASTFAPALTLMISQTVFGMTNFKLDAVWFPIAAVLALAATAILWSLIKLFTSKWPKFRQRYERKSSAVLKNSDQHLDQKSSYSKQDPDLRSSVDFDDDETMFDDEAPEEDEEKLYQKPATSISSREGDTTSNSDSDSDSEEEIRSNKRGRNDASTHRSENVYRIRRGAVATSESYAPSRWDE